VFYNAFVTFTGSREFLSFFINANRLHLWSFICELQVGSQAVTAFKSTWRLVWPFTHSFSAMGLLIPDRVGRGLLNVFFSQRYKTEKKMS
jgi:hypothetical protein